MSHLKIFKLVLRPEIKKKTNNGTKLKTQNNGKRSPHNTLQGLNLWILSYFSLLIIHFIYYKFI